MNWEDLHTFRPWHWHICTMLPLSTWAGRTKMLEMVAPHGSTEKCLTMKSKMYSLNRNDRVEFRGPMYSVDFVQALR